MQKTALFVLLAGGCALAADADDIKQLDQQWAQACMQKDAKSLDRVFADDLRYVHGSGIVETKQQFMAAIQSGDIVYRTLQFEDVQVRVLSDVAVVTSSPRMTITLKGQEQKFQARFLRVYLKRNGAWKMLAHQATRLP